MVFHRVLRSCSLNPWSVIFRMRVIWKELLFHIFCLFSRLVGFVLFIFSFFSFFSFLLFFFAFLQIRHGNEHKFKLVDSLRYEDCERSLFCTKIRGKERKNWANERLLEKERLLEVVINDWYFTSALYGLDIMRFFFIAFLFNTFSASNTMRFRRVHNKTKFAFFLMSLDQARSSAANYNRKKLSW